MHTVLSKTFIGIAISILLNAIAYFCINDDSAKEIIILLGEIAMVCAIPIISGYIITYLSYNKHNIIIYSINIFLFVLNLFLLISASFLILFAAFFLPIAILSASYLVVGYYVFSETIQDPNKPFQKFKISSDDILDDNL